MTQQYQPYEPTQTMPPAGPGPQQYPGYGAPSPYGPYGYAAPLPPHPQASTVLVLGILGLVSLTLLSPIAFYMGRSAKRECAAGRYAEDGQLQAGYVMGIIGTIVLGASVALMVVAVILFVCLSALNF